MCSVSRNRHHNWPKRMPFPTNLGRKAQVGGKQIRGEGHLLAKPGFSSLQIKGVFEWNSRLLVEVLGFKIQSITTVQCRISCWHAQYPSAAVGAKLNRTLNILERTNAGGSEWQVLNLAVEPNPRLSPHLIGSIYLSVCHSIS